MWDDLIKFKLPSVVDLKDKALSCSFLSESLIDITNNFLDWAQHESNAKASVNELKMIISGLENAYERDLQKKLAQDFDKIPVKQQRNRDLQIGWILNNDKDFTIANELIIDNKLKLVAKQHDLDLIQSRMSAAKHVLDVGRSILSAMKEELRNL